MDSIKSGLSLLWREEEGLTTVEYAVAGGLITVTIVAAFITLGDTVGSSIEGLIDLLQF